MKIYFHESCEIQCTLKEIQQCATSLSVRRMSSYNRQVVRKAYLLTVWTVDIKTFNWVLFSLLTVDIVFVFCLLCALLLLQH